MNQHCGNDFLGILFLFRVPRSHLRSQKWTAFDIYSTATSARGQHEPSYFPNLGSRVLKLTALEIIVTNRGGPETISEINEKILDGQRPTGN